MTLTETRAAFIAAIKTIKFVGPHYCVPSESGNDAYEVILGEQSTCTCEHFQTARDNCKHIIAAWMVVHREHDGKPVEVVVDEVPKKPTVERDWSRYNQAQESEEPRMLELLHQLVQGIEEPLIRRPGRQPFPMKDRVFACVLKVFSTWGARRFKDRLKDAHKKGLLNAPMNSGSVWAFMEDKSMTPVLQKLIEVSALPLRSLERVFAVDASVFLSNWREQAANLNAPITLTEPAPYAGVKAHAIVGTTTHVAAAVMIDAKMSGDSPKFNLLVLQAHEAGFSLQEVCADKAYLSHENLSLIEDLGATAYIPLKSNSLPGEQGSAWSRFYHRVGLDREKFLQHYHKRSNVESVFSAVKRKYGHKIRSRASDAMANEVLCKFLCQNIWAVHHAIVVLGVAGEFWSDDSGIEAQAGDTDEPTVLQMPALRN
ncbi:MAG TPA: transposase [Gemmataceae bacterium]|jgi:hypothetical protein|nr:transposase [Gemmataceae bacterium]